MRTTYKLSFTVDMDLREDETLEEVLDEIKRLVPGVIPAVDDMRGGAVMGSWHTDPQYKPEK